MFGSTRSCCPLRDILSGVSSSLHDLLPAPLAGRHNNRPPFSEVMAEPGKAWFLVRLNWGTLGRLWITMLRVAELAETEGSQVSQMVNPQVWEKKTGVGELADPQLPTYPQLPAAASGKARSSMWARLPRCCCCPFLLLDFKLPSAGKFFSVSTRGNCGLLIASCSLWPTF